MVACSPGSADVHGLDWFDEMVKVGEALTFGDSPGYPCGYIAMAKDLARHIVEQPPEVRRHLNLHVVEAPQGASPKVEYGERAFIDEATVAGCSPDQWLGMEAWDQS